MESRPGRRLRRISLSPTSLRQRARHACILAVASGTNNDTMVVFTEGGQRRVTDSPATAQGLPASCFPARPVHGPDGVGCRIRIQMRVVVILEPCSRPNTSATGPRPFAHPAPTNGCAARSLSGLLRIACGVPLAPGGPPDLPSGRSSQSDGSAVSALGTAPTYHGSTDRILPMPDLVDTVRQQIESRLAELRPLAREASDLQSALDALNGVTAASAAGGRGRRRQAGRPAARRHSHRSAGGARVRVIEYVAANPGSTASDVANALGLNRNSVATRLTQLSKRGQLVKAPRGYSLA